MTTNEPPGILHNVTADLSGADVANREPLELHRRLPGYQPTPLIEAPSLASRLGLGRVLVKDESDRFGLPHSRSSVPPGRVTGLPSTASVSSRLHGAHSRSLLTASAVCGP